ncbi:response regulator [Rhodoblastus acidophilus]|uniref:chemotaxis protein CheB n=1 Tax=Candidatus Rhodoblastus alkanivorans TaxID=2954117 RepID=UPI001FAB0A0A|nr:chemotaxis protein CheB [Candidatus Rhodoblastus alkanivorans]MCI4678928.1 response regulator [Candidatus Rhodoblastus alkanivorans]MDI4641023.1 response regulator [Rhodoblastus acidophilus]
MRDVRKRSAKKSEAPSSEPEQRPAAKAESFPVVAVGASAGGLDACRKVLDALPPHAGFAFILVQHLDPTHESMLVELLAGHTSMQVCQATDGLKIEREHLYVIPPGSYLSVKAGALRLSQPRDRHGARRPFDFLLHSLAEEYAARAICVVLSGTGTDGSSGLKAIMEQGGLVIAQDPEEAGYDGMPRNAILTGAVDLVLPAAKIPEAILKYDARAGRNAPAQESARDWLAEIIDLLHTKTAHDFRPYKQGTLQRRIERRMALQTGGMVLYLQKLRGDPEELDLLAKDLLINVTRFFRDPTVFEFLAEKVIPGLVADQPADQPLRIWIAGCSSGEETYSLAMLFREAIAAANKNVKLQVFASDIDADAVAQAREGFYPASIEADVSAERLARFFVKEERGYRILPELRADVVFTVQDLLADPPFSRLDFVSCRNLLIYLGPEAQAKVMALFHFALREGGVLLLGGAETVGEPHGCFTAISKSERIFRHTARGRPGDFGFLGGDGVRIPARQGQGQGQGRAPTRETILAELCRRLVLEHYTPAAVLINRKNERLFSLGPTDRYLFVPPGQPTHDLLATARQGLGAKLRSAIQRVFQENAPVTVAGCRVDHDGGTICFSLSARRVESEGEELALICFLDEATQERRQGGAVAPGDVSRIAELEQELETTRIELQGAIRNLEISGEEQKAINEEALSVNEELQSTNEELLTSKEELQSLNEELTALNNQLQETLDRQRTTADDLQNVLYSTDVATIFLDAALKIRFFTPATRSLFNVIASDVGRPLADLASLVADSALLSDARAVLAKHLPIERQIEARSGAWYMRRILPYRTQGGGVEGVVITFADITDRKDASDALEAAKRKAEAADAAKSRFLAAASHDLRQPLQTLALLQGLLTRAVESERERQLVARIGETLGGMTGMLNALLDINQIEAGAIRSEMALFPVNDLLVKLHDEFTYQAHAKALDLRVVSCGLSIFSDPRLLETMVRNLLSNALKYTKSGKVLLGWRRRKGMLSIEVWDTGIGIPDEEIQAIFVEYHQVGNEARERSLGLGLGLSIVRRIGNLLGHRVRVRSHDGHGSVFSIEVALPQVAAPPELPEPGPDFGPASGEKAARKGAILVVEDDPELRELLAASLSEEGHRMARAYDGSEAMQLIEREDFRPDVILADFNLPNRMNGLEVVAKVREKLHRAVPAIILTGDISTRTLRAIADADCVLLNKPVKLDDVTRAVQRALASKHAPPRAKLQRPVETVEVPRPPVIYVVDDDSHIRATIRSVLEDDGRTVEDFADCEAFLKAYRPGREACLLIDAYLPGMSGLELLRRLNDEGHRLPAIMITGNADVTMAVQAIKAGASDFIEKPVGRDELLACVEHALEHSQDESKLIAWREDAASHLEGLTPRQKQVMEMVLAGHPSKNIAADLGISQRTVENHRAAIMKRTGVKSLPALARLAVAAEN